MGKKRKSPKSLLKHIGNLEHKAHDLELDIVRIRTRLLIADNQPIYRTYRFLYLLGADMKNTFIRKETPPPLVQVKRTPEEKKVELKTSIIALKRRQKILIMVSRSPYMLIVWLLRTIRHIVFFIPSRIESRLIRQELNQTASAKKDTDIIWFGSNQYLEGRTRARFLVEAMAAKGKRVFYIESKLSQVAKGKSRFDVRKVSSNLYVVTLSAARDIDIQRQPAAGREIQSIDTSFRHFRKEAGISRSVAVIDHPFWGYLQPRLDIPAVYDCNQDFGDGGTEPHIRQLHRLLVKKSSMVISSSRLLLKELKKLKPLKIKLVSNGCDYEHFAKGAIKKDTCSAGLCWIRKPVIGYIGSCDKRIDAELVEKVALAYPKASIVMIGKIDNPALLNVGERLPNVFLLGEKPYEKLPEYLQTFDACFIPSKCNEKSVYFDSEALYTFLAAGKATVVFHINEGGFNIILYVAKTTESFINYIHTAATEKGKMKIITRQKRAEKISWPILAAKFARELHNIQKKV